MAIDYKLLSQQQIEDFKSYLIESSQSSSENELSIEQIDSMSLSSLFEQFSDEFENYANSTTTINLTDLEAQSALNKGNTALSEKKRNKRRDKRNRLLV